MVWRDGRGGEVRVRWGCEGRGRRTRGEGVAAQRGWEAMDEGVTTAGNGGAVAGEGSAVRMGRRDGRRGDGQGVEDGREGWGLAQMGGRDRAAARA